MKFSFYKIIFFFLIFIFFVSIIHFIFKINYISLNNYEETRFINKQLQGIECIDKKVVLLEEQGNISFLNKKFIKIVSSFYRPSANKIKEKNILSHPNSLLVLEDGTAYASNTFTRLPAKIVKFNFNKLISDANLLEKNIQNIFRNEYVRSIHLEKINYNNKEKILKAEKRFNSKYYNFTINDINLNVEKCLLQINEKFIQNLYWDNKNSLYIIKNLIGKRGGILKTYNFFKMNKDCPEINKGKIIIYLTDMELEGYITCNGNEYLIFIDDKDSIIYKKSLI